MKATCYHIRNMNGQKLLGGSLGMADASMDLNKAAEKLTREFDIIVMQSGRLSYSYRGTPVWLYLSLNPDQTEKGRAVLAAHKATRAEAQRVETQADEAQNEALMEAVNALGIEQATKLLQQAKGD